MTETLTEIGDRFMAENPGVEIVFNFDSSGTLKTQIEEGADVDVFISAGQKQMNQLDITADPEVNTDGLDFVLEDTRFNILENKVALAVPEGNPAGIESYDDWAAKLATGEIFMADSTFTNLNIGMGNGTVNVSADEGLSGCRMELKTGNGEVLYNGASQGAECLIPGSGKRSLTVQIGSGSITVDG